MVCDRIIGTWKGSKNVPFLASGKLIVTFKEDNTGVGSGTIHALGQTYNLNNEIIRWRNVGPCQYIGEYQQYRLGFSMNPSGTQVQVVFNAYRLGLMNSPLFNQDITITMYRA